MKRLATLSLSLTVILFSIGSQAQMFDMKHVKAVKDSIQPLLKQVQGLNGYGITSCEPGTNQAPTSNRDRKDICISAYFENDEALENFAKVFPDETRVEAVAIRRTVLGKIRAQ